MKIKISAAALARAYMPSRATGGVMPVGITSGVAELLHLFVTRGSRRVTLTWVTRRKGGEIMSKWHTAHAPDDIVEIDD